MSLSRRCRDDAAQERLHNDVPVVHTTATVKKQKNRFKNFGKKYLTFCQQSVKIFYCIFHVLFLSCKDTFGRYFFAKTAFLITS